MAFKHQSDCYRTFDGLRWPNLCDVMSDEDETSIAERKALGQRIRMRKHPEGYLQAFIHPNDFETRK